ncbi:hypothetical protein GTP23_19665 [Pseudoduganella sp. FT93W]|uniref:FimV N-terminal domain-containing protein n=1 Tax=Duganella fentianensis TaxID=2692177 RepID=A0A845I620_9BURK|nr:hypothetical protein [Duganella fentianensis]MYN47266.1 hypothetical protein [Duganella fentianensis]
MQRSPFLTSITTIAGSLLLATAAPAAELGDIAVRSYIGQPLSADIELVQVAPDEAASLQVRLAQENVYRGANISMNPALTGLHMTIVRRDGRQYLRVSTSRPIEADYLHLFLELSGGGRQEVRAATVWLQADPNPSMRTSAVPAAAVGSPAPAPLPAVAAAPVSPAEPAPVRSRAAPMPSLHESEVGVPGGLRASAAAAPVRRPAAPARPAPARAASSGEAATDGALPVPVAQALLPMPNLPLPKGVKRAQPPAACAAAPASAPAAAKECAAFDAHSQQLNSKLTELEGKLKVLQGALGAAPAAKASAAAPAATADAKPAASSAAASATASASASVASSAPAKLASSAAAHASEPAAAGGEAASGERWVPPPGVQGELAKARAAAALAEASEAGAASASASASASAEAAASEAASVPMKKVKVLPKLKYKKEKPPEPSPGSSTLPLIAAGAGVAALVLGLAGWLFWRKKRGAPPLKIGQLFRKKKAAEPEVKHEEAPPLEEVTPESLMQQ